jgi:glutamate--cysteine ligase
VQLNANILQIENEYYSAIRPKQIVGRGERPACALNARGVRYIEVRLLDVDPFEPLGLSLDTARFMEVFLLVCLAQGREGKDAVAADKNNQNLAIRYGRKADLKLMRGADSILLRAWADEFLDDCALVAERLDAVPGNQGYSRAVSCQRRKLQDPALLPSARVLDESAAGGYDAWAKDLSQRYTANFAAANMPPDRLAALQSSVTASFAEVAALESEPAGDFADYVRSYFDSLCDEKLAALL